MRAEPRGADAFGKRAGLLLCARQVGQQNAHVDPRRAGRRIELLRAVTQRSDLARHVISRFAQLERGLVCEDEQAVGLFGHRHAILGQPARGEAQHRVERERFHPYAAGDIGEALRRARAVALPEDQQRHDQRQGAGRDADALHHFGERRHAFAERVDREADHQRDPAEGEDADQRQQRLFAGRGVRRRGRILRRIGESHVRRHIDARRLLNRFGFRCFGLKRRSRPICPPVHDAFLHPSGRGGIVRRSWKIRVGAGHARMIDADRCGSGLAFLAPDGYRAVMRFWGVKAWRWQR